MDGQNDYLAIADAEVQGVGESTQDSSPDLAAYTLELKWVFARRRHGSRELSRESVTEARLTSFIPVASFLCLNLGLRSKQNGSWHESAA